MRLHTHLKDILLNVYQYKKIFKSCLRIKLIINDTFPEGITVLDITEVQGVLLSVTLETEVLFLI
jgi:hypothetical protein